LDDLKPVLERLFIALDRLHVPIVSSLQPGLAEEVVARLLSRVPYDLPPDLSELYKWRNGAQESAASRELFPGGMFLALSQAVTTYQGLVAAATEASKNSGLDVKDVYDPCWMPMFIDAGGNLHAIKVGNDPDVGSVWEIPIEDPQNRRVISENLRDFIDTITRRWENGTYYLSQDGGMPRESYPRLAAERRANDDPKADIQLLVRQLGSEDSKERARSLDLLKRYLFPEAVQPLISLLGHGNPEIRSDAVAILAQIGDTAAVPALVKARQDSDSRVRARVEWALRELRGQ
jgi:cell wall assembly regulator SMI1